MTPAYPKFSNSYINNVSTTKMKLFNKREDISYYKVEVLTNDWKPIAFASTNKIIKLDYNKTILFDVYVQTKDIKHVVYICTVSKNFKQEKKVTLVASRICSKID
jgi:hypothetical protein|tara:strand:- start:407 stop:721 length:315 start_codon:yes stop_codon:yes gene_type:complete